MSFKNSTLSNYVKNLSGKRFGRLIAVRHVGSPKGRAVFACICDCGEYVFVLSSSLSNGKTKSCGCLQREARELASSVITKTNGAVMKKTYTCWRSMKGRCLNKKLKSYPIYGGRGIKVCDRWMVFKNFLEDMGVAPPALTLDRIDNDGDYEPGNCRWASRKEQANNRSTNTWLEINGERKTIAQWAEFAGVGLGTIHGRLRRSNWTQKEAVFGKEKKKR